MKLFSLLFVFFLFLESVSARASDVRWLTPDFAVYAVAHGERVPAFSPRAVAKDCRSSIAASICLVDPPPAGGGFGCERVCLEGGERYTKYFEELYDQFPSTLQKMFCHLNKIYVEKDFIGSAYGGVQREGNAEDGAVIGGVLGIRRSLLDQPSSLDEWASWKEQLHFGADPRSVHVMPGLPVVHSNMGDTQAGMLYFLVAHEFGHIFDFTNRLNEGGSWQALSWKDSEVPLDQFEFPLRKELCFYFCEGKFLSASRQDELYQALSRTNFLSAYATRYAAEDFADSFAFYWAMTERGLSYHVITASGFDYDAIGRLRGDPMMAPKKQYIENFLNSEYRYPGGGG